ncbi:MAG: hypothetical protein ACJ8GN_31535 [Longimicrobiaceae bacterium]
MEAAPWLFLIHIDCFDWFSDEESTSDDEPGSVTPSAIERPPF